MESIIRDIALAEQGKVKIDWVRAHMPVLDEIGKRFAAEQTFRGMRMAICIHLEAKTARMAQLLQEAGAEVYVCGSNPLTTKDDVCAALAASGVTVYATHGCDVAELEGYMLKCLEKKPHLIIDDGGDMVQLLHEKVPEYAENLMGGSEETTTGVLRLVARSKAGKLRFPMVLVNDGDCKHLFDNRYGTGQSVWDGIMRTTNINVAGRTAVVAGYGWCGKGVAMRAKGLGAQVIVTEVDPIKAIEAIMDGFTVLPMREAAPLGDFFITVTGCKDVLTAEHLQGIKDGAILCNAGHFDVEVSVKQLRESAVKSWKARENIEGFLLPCGKTVYLLAEGRLVNIAAGDGHAAEIMDMSFALQALSAEYVLKNHKKLPPEALPVPKEIDDYVARVKLASLGVAIDTLTEEQRAYLAGWEI